MWPMTGTIRIHGCGYICDISIWQLCRDVGSVTTVISELTLSGSRWGFKSADLSYDGFFNCVANCVGGELCLNSALWCVCWSACTIVAADSSGFAIGALISCFSSSEIKTSFLGKKEKLRTRKSRAVVFGVCYTRIEYSDETVWSRHSVFSRKDFAIPLVHLTLTHSLGAHHSLRPCYSRKLRPRAGVTEKSRVNRRLTPYLSREGGGSCLCYWSIFGSLVCMGKETLLRNSPVIWKRPGKVPDYRNAGDELADRSTCLIGK